MRAKKTDRIGVRLNKQLRALLEDEVRERDTSVTSIVRDALRKRYARKLRAMAPITPSAANPPEARPSP